MYFPPSPPQPLHSPNPQTPTAQPQLVFIYLPRKNRILCSATGIARLSPSLFSSILGLGFAILLAPACLAYLWNAQNHNKHVCTQYFSFRGDQLDIQMLQSVTM